MEFKDKVKNRRIELNLTLEDVAKIVKVSTPTIQRYESGEIKNVRRDKIKLLSDALQVTPSYLMGWENEESSNEINDKVAEYDEIYKAKNDYKKVPILGTIAAGQPLSAQEDIEGYEMVSKLDRVNFCLRVKGDSMINARIHDGDIVYIRQQPDVENGEIAAVIIDNEEATLKRVYKVNGNVILRPENSNYKDFIYSKDDFKDVRILGKAVLFKSEVK